MAELPGTIKRGKVTAKGGVVNSIIEELVSKEYFRKKNIHGADAVFCPLKASLHNNWQPGYNQPRQASSAFYFSIGNAVHSTIYDALRKADILVAEELRIEFMGINGFVDAIIIDPETGNLKILDVKTCGKLPTKIKPGQREQLMTYVLITGIDDASIIYQSRNVAGWDGIPLMREIPLQVNDTEMADAAYILAETVLAVKHRIIPHKPEYRTSPSNCGWCPFKDFGCWSTDSGHWSAFVDERAKHIEDLTPDEQKSFYLDVDKLATKIIDQRAGLLERTLKMLPVEKTS